MTRLAWLYALLLAFAAAWLGWGIAQGSRLQTDLTALLPADAQVDAVWRTADEAGEKQLNGQILLLVGSEDADRAFAAAEQVADRWQNSGLFAAVDSRLTPDLAQLRQEIRRLGVNALPREQQQLLLHDPAAYFQNAPKTRPTRLPRKSCRWKTTGSASPASCSKNSPPAACNGTAATA